MNRAQYAEGQVLFREGDPADSVFRLLSGSVDILRELDGDPILLGTIGAGQFIGEMGVVENRPRNATARAASEVEVEILTPNEFFDQITGSPRAVRKLIQRLVAGCARPTIASSTMKGEAAEPRTRKDADSHTAVKSVNNYLAAKNPWLRTSVPQVRSSSAIFFCRSSLAGGLLHGKGCRRCIQISNSMTPPRSDCRAIIS